MIYKEKAFIMNFVVKKDRSNVICFINGSIEKCSIEKTWGRQLYKRAPLLYIFFLSQKLLHRCTTSSHFKYV